MLLQFVHDVIKNTMTGKETEKQGSKLRKCKKRRLLSFKARNINDSTTRQNFITLFAHSTFTVPTQNNISTGYN